MGRKERLTKVSGLNSHGQWCHLGFADGGRAGSKTQQELVMSHVGFEMHVRHQEGSQVDRSVLESRAQGK